jgi:hypothetical protein
MGGLGVVLRNGVCSRGRKGAQGVRDRYESGMSYCWTGCGELAIVSSAIGGSDDDSA